MGVFVEITLDERRLGPAVVRTLASVCPVDIFGLDGEQLAVRLEEVDLFELGRATYRREESV